MKILAGAVGDPATAPQVTGFIESPFTPLVHQVAEQLLSDVDVTGLGVVLASELGDSVTTDLSSRLLTGGRPANALLFMQATSNAVLGRISIEHGITGPLLSISPGEHPGGGPLDVAEVLLADLDCVLVLGVELTGTPRTDAVHRARGTTPPATDLAAGLLVGHGDGLPQPHPPGVAGLHALATTITAQGERR
ncbi:hypothetical protein [Lentzea sp. NPDC060358]|uniref:hypothetical protein n=1 Tax=Lentzea sp. NPDC060358 TaxID=3347103 RepID=UPI00364EB03C